MTKIIGVIVEEMINLYYGKSSKSSRQSVFWFEGLGIKVTKKRIETLTRKDLINILSLSENGFSDLLKRETGRRIHINVVKKRINDGSFEDAITYLLANTDIIKVPIIFDEHRLLIGFNTESIRMFVTKDFRRCKRILNKI